MQLRRCSKQMTTRPQDEDISMAKPLEPDVEMVRLPARSSPENGAATAEPSWDNEEDPATPQNWPKQAKWITTILISAFSFNTMMTATLVAPALPSIAHDLNVSNKATEELMLSAYVLSYGFGPFLWGPLSELFGRVRTLQVASTWFLIWNMVCGFAKTGGVMIAGRVLSGLGGSAALAISSGVLSDCWRSKERGRSLAVYTFIPLLGPAIGPILGGLMTEHSTWRWTFWSTSAFGAVLQLLAVVFFRETHHDTILRRKSGKRGHQSARLRIQETRLPMLTALQRPFRILTSQLVVLLLAIFSGISFGIMYIYLTTIPTIFSQQYHQSTSVAGLNYISFGIGFIIGAQGSAYSTDFMYQKKTLPAPELRLALLLPSVITASLGLLCLGWSAQTRTHWTVPNFGILMFGVGIQSSTQSINAYIIDVYGPVGWSASAMAGIWALKSVAGFGFPLFAPDMFRLFGFGWSSSILAAALLAVGAPVSLSTRYYGGTFRRMGEKRLHA